MSVPLSVAVMAVPERIGRVASVLQPAIGHAAVWVDDDRRGVWWNARRAWTTHESHPRGWHIVLQDDAVLCQHFDAGVRAALEALDAADLRVPVSFFGNRMSFEWARNDGSCWVSVQNVTWAVALAMPVEFIGPWLNWCDDFVSSEYEHDDYRLAMYLRATKRRAWCTCPSLVDHDTTVKSVLGHGAGNRRARVFIGDGDPRSIDWSRGVLHPVRDNGVTRFEGLLA